MKREFLPFLAVCVGAIVLATGVTGQENETVGLRISEYLTIGGELRTRYEILDNFDFTPNVADHNDMVFMRTRLGFDFDVNDDVVARIQLQDFRRWGDFQDATGSNSSNLSDKADFALREGYVDLRRIFSDKLSARIGRQAIHFGEERVFSDLDWNNVGLTHDAARITYQSGKARRHHLFYIAAEENDSLTAVNSAGEAQLFGFYTEAPFGPFQRFDPYYVFQSYDSETLDAQIPQVLTSGASGGDANIHTFGLLASGQLGARWDWSAEGNYQTGDFGRFSLRSHLFHGRLGYIAGSRHLDKLSASYSAYSGDKNSSDREINTYQPIFPYFYRTNGLIRWLAMKNMNTVKVSGHGNLAGKWDWAIDWYRFSREERSDDLYDAASRNAVAWIRRGNDGYFGQEVDLILTYPWKDDVSWTTSYSTIYPGSAIREARAAGGRGYSGVHNFVTQLEVSF